MQKKTLAKTLWKKEQGKMQDTEKRSSLAGMQEAIKKAAEVGRGQT